MKRTSLLILFLTGCSSSHMHERHERLTYTEATPHDLQSDTALPFFFQLQQGKVEEAISELQAAKAKDPYLYHSKTLEKLAISLLEQGIQSSNKTDVELSLYGIGLAANEQAQSLLTEVLKSSYPELQLTAVQLLAGYNTDESYKLLEKALTSDYLIIRLEAIHALASKQLPSTYPQIEALYVKVDPEFRPFFPQLLALDGTTPSIQMLRRLVRDSNPWVRLEAIRAIGLLRRDDLLPDIKSQMHDLSPALQEACVNALGSFQERSSKPFLEKMMTSHDLTALVAAFYLSNEQYILKEAESGNLFAYKLLNKSENHTQFLLEKMQSPDLQERLNATTTLLMQKDRRCLEMLPMLFIQSSNDLVFEELSSPGKALSQYKATPSAQQNLKQAPFYFELSLRLREEWLIQAMELPEEDFLDLAQCIFHYQQHDLVPILVRLLENIRSEKAIALLKEQSERLGSPFIRTYAALALFRLNEEGPYAQKLLEWISKNQTHDLIQARPILPWKIRSEKSPYSLTLEERSRLLVEAYEALALSHKEESITALLNAIKSGNKHNRYLLAGLLMRAAE
ncbi:MAG: hypothetical protein JWO53_992 [Chlamydiia bacterium]|nr:hypothetical protein [Chlamydiia bacterium]